MLDERCGRRGEVLYGEQLLVCYTHYRFLEAWDRTILLGGMVSTLDLCIESLSLRRDPKVLSEIKSQRSEKARDLAEARQDLQGAENK